MHNKKKRNVLGIPFHPFKYNDAIDSILLSAEIMDRCTSVFTPNVQHLYLYHHDDNFKNAYENVDFSLIDGMPLIWAKKLLKNKNVDKISGSDIFVDLFKKAASKNLKILIIGGADGVAIKAIENLGYIHKINKSIFTWSPPFGFEKDANERQILIEKINEIKPNVLFVALGSPKQELWISESINELNAGVALGIGASIDFVAGIQKRAPVWMQKNGLEWFYRLMSDPKRLFKRYFITNLFYFKCLVLYMLGRR